MSAQDYAGSGALPFGELPVCGFIGQLGKEENLLTVFCTLLAKVILLLAYVTKGACHSFEGLIKGFIFSGQQYFLLKDEVQPKRNGTARHIGNSPFAIFIPIPAMLRV